MSEERGMGNTEIPEEMIEKGFEALKGDLGLSFAPGSLSEKAYRGTVLEILIAAGVPRLLEDRECPNCGCWVMHPCLES